MSTIQEQFEAMLVLYRPHAEKMTFENSEGVTEYWNPVENLAWKMWQAATEAAKATGTAGELPPLPNFSSYGEYFRKELEYHCLQYGQQCAEAARQSVSVTTAQEEHVAFRVWAKANNYITGSANPITGAAWFAWQARAALAATAAPVLMPEDIATDDALWCAGCKAFRLALNEMTGCDGYVVRKTYEALRAHILGSQP